MTKQARTGFRLIPLGTGKAETRGVATTFSPDDNLQRKPSPGLAGD